jgi:hypothetical protein
MGILGTIISKVFGSKKEAPAPAAAPAAEVVATVVAGTAIPAIPADFDVTGYLNELRSQAQEKLDWTVSIVDLMKLVGMDSSLSARKELAQELGYGQDMQDTAKMNIWLHKQVMQRIAQHGGQLPAELIA